MTDPFILHVFTCNIVVYFGLDTLFIYCTQDVHQRSDYTYQLISFYFLLKNKNENYCAIERRSEQAHIPHYLTMLHKMNGRVCIKYTK